MFSDKYELRSLYDNKHEYIRGKRNDTSDGSGASSSTELSFLGPVLWEDTYTINDLDNINLEEFSPTVLYEASNSSQGWNDVFEPEEKDQSSKSIELNPPWTSISNLEPSITQLPPPTPLVTRKKSRVPLEQKNEKYWNRRMRNNASAKRSRDARRMMENQVYAKAALLERENAQLRLELDRLASENKTLRDLLSAKPSCCVVQGSMQMDSVQLEPCPEKTSVHVPQPVSVPLSVARTNAAPQLQYRLIQPRGPEV